MMMMMIMMTMMMMKKSRTIWATYDHRRTNPERSPNFTTSPLFLSDQRLFTPLSIVAQQSFDGETKLPEPIHPSISLSLLSSLFSLLSILSLSLFYLSLSLFSLSLVSLPLILVFPCGFRPILFLSNVLASVFHLKLIKTSNGPSSGQQPVRSLIEYIHY